MIWVLDMGSLLGWKFFSNPDEPEGALEGFAEWYYGWASSLSPTHAVACFDAGSERRRAIDSDYKLNRAAKPKPEGYIEQLRRAPEFVAALGIPCLRIAGEEADDIVASVVTQMNQDEITIVSSDKDLAQLVTEGVRLYDPKPTAGGEYRVWDHTTIRERIGVDPWRMADFLAMAGDTADNIPGIVGIGATYATVAINQTRSMAELFRKATAGTLESLKPATQKKIAEGRPQFEHCLSLVKLHCTLPVPNDINFYSLTRKDNEEASTGSDHFAPDKTVETSSQKGSEAL